MHKGEFVRPKACQTYPGCPCQTIPLNSWWHEFAKRHYNTPAKEEEEGEEGEEEEEEEEENAAGCLLNAQNAFVLKIRK